MTGPLIYPDVTLECEMTDPASFSLDAQLVLLHLCYSAFKTPEKKKKKLSLIRLVAFSIRRYLSAFQLK